MSMNNRRHARNYKPRTHKATELPVAEMHAIERHISMHVAKPAFVMHEIVSETVHVDVHVVAPAPDRPYWFLFTTGMSARPMNVPMEACASRFAELAILLPPDWRLDRESLKSGEWFWPVRKLIDLARMPHQHRTWLGYGHTVIDGVPPEPYDPSTRLSAIVVLPSVSLPEATQEIPVGPRKRVELHTLWPVYPEELELKTDDSLDALLDCFEEAGVSDVVDPKRLSAVRDRDLVEIRGIEPLTS